jgi:hypothetical protein
MTTATATRTATRTMARRRLGKPSRARRLAAAQAARILPSRGQPTGQAAAAPKYKPNVCVLFPRERFRLGYINAVLCLRAGDDKAGKCFGSAGGTHGPSMAHCVTPEQVLSLHWDKVYALGWAAGYADEKAGLVRDSRDIAYEAALAAGKVAAARAASNVIEKYAEPQNAVAVRPA